MDPQIKSTRKRHSSSSAFDMNLHSSRFIWSVISKKYLSEPETCELNRNVKDFFEVLRDWRSNVSRQKESY